MRRRAERTVTEALTASPEQERAYLFSPEYRAWVDTVAGVLSMLGPDMARTCLANDEARDAATKALERGRRAESDRRLEGVVPIDLAACRIDPRPAER